MIVAKIASRSGSIRLKSNIFQKEAEKDNKNRYFYIEDKSCLSIRQKIDLYTNK